MESYKKFVRQNREFVRSLESMANVSRSSRFSRLSEFFSSS